MCLHACFGSTSIAAALCIRSKATAHSDELITIGSGPMALQQYVNDLNVKYPHQLIIITPIVSTTLSQQLSVDYSSIESASTITNWSRTSVSVR
jgi:hypothetical protein